MVALGGSGELASQLTAADIPVHQIPALQRDVAIFKELAACWQIAVLIRQEHPDILHLNSSKAGLIGSVLGRLLRVPRIIFTAHGWAFNEDRGRTAKLVIKFMHWCTVLFSHQTIAVAKAIRTNMRLPGTQKKMLVIHNGMEKPAFLDRTIARHKLMEVQPKLTAFHTDLWSISIGELHSNKQHATMIEAMYLLRNTHPTFRHLIIGEGEERDRLEALIQKYNLAENVFLLGAIPQAATYLHATDIFVLPSRTEAWPYVALEAANADLPIVASRVGGIPELLQNNTSALLVPSGDDTSFAAALTLLLDNESLRKQLANAASKAAATYTISTMVDQTTAAYLATLR